MDCFYNPVRTVLGPGCTENLPNILQDMQLVQNKILFLVWQESVLSEPIFAALLDNQVYQTISICFTESNPQVEQLFMVYEQTRQFAPDVVIAIGGGSVLDVGKSLCCLYQKDISSVEALRQAIIENEWRRPQVRWIGIPTTAGTGSEVTCWATIWDTAQETKRSISCQENYAYAALIDPLYAATMPTGLAVSSALDAMAHAMESYWAKASNTVSKALALQAISYIMDHLDLLLEHQSEAQFNMAKGSMLAGLAFSNTKTTACHSISYPLTMQYGIPHGVAVSMLLAAVLRLNVYEIVGLPALLQALRVKDVDTLQQKIKIILQKANIKTTLQDWGVPREALPELAGHGLTKGRADNNPVVLDIATVETILEEIYE